MNQKPNQKPRRQQKPKSTEIAVVEKSQLDVAFDKIISEMHERFDEVALNTNASFDEVEQAIDFTKARADVDDLFDDVEQMLEDEAAQVEAEAAEKHGDRHELMAQAVAACGNAQDELLTTLRDLENEIQQVSWTAAKVKAAVAMDTSGS